MLRSSPVARRRGFVRNLALAALALAGVAFPHLGVEAQEPWIEDPGFARTPLRVTTEGAFSLKVLASGKVLVCSINGQFLAGANGQRVGALVRLDPATGAVDPTWVPDPSLQAVTLNGVVEAPDGKIYVSTALAGELAQSPSDPAIFRIVRLLPDGARDLSFQSPVFGFPSRFLGVQPDGKLLVCSGQMPLRGTPPADSIVETVRLNLDGSRDASFQSPNFQVNATDPPARAADGRYLDAGVFGTPVIEPVTGKIYFCGTFRFVNGQPRKGVVRCHPDGTLDASFVPTGLIGGTAPLSVRGLVLQTDGKLVVGGNNLRTAAGGVTRYNLLRFLPDGTLDPNFTLVPTTTSAGVPLAGSYTGPRFIAALPDGRIQGSESRVLRFLADGALDPSFTPLVFRSPFAPSSLVAAFNFGIDASSGAVYLAHPAGRYALLNETPVNGVTKLTPAGAIDSAFVGPTIEAETFAPQVRTLGAGKLLVAGLHDAYGTTSNASVARVLPDGTLDPLFGLGLQPFADKQAADLALLPDESAYVLFQSGSFTGGYLFTNLVKLTAAGVLDTTFSLSPALQSTLGVNAYDGADTSRAEIRQIAPGPGGSVHILPPSSPQSTLDVEGQLRLVRALPNGSADATVPALGFAAGEVTRDGLNHVETVSTGYFRRVGRTADGGLLALISVAPFPGSTNEPYRFRLCKIRPDGSVDAAFQAPAIINGLAPEVSFPLLSDPVTGLQTQTSSGAWSYPTGYSLPIVMASEAPDGSVYAVGAFRFVGEAGDLACARFAADGSRDLTFTSPSLQNAARPNRPALATSVAVDAGGKVWLAGRFDTVGGAPAPGVARLQANGLRDTSFSLNYLGFDDTTSDVTDVVLTPSKAYLVGTFRRSGESRSFAVTRIQIGTASAPTLTSALPPALAVVGQPYSHRFTATGLPAATFTVTGGTLPPGLTLSSDGLLSGVPQAGSQTLFANIVVSASNGLPPAATQTFSLRLATTSASYLAGFGLVGPNAAPGLDFARDGVPNLLKYALGLNPTVAGGAPVAAQIRSYAGLPYLSLTFRRSALATDLTYVVEVANDLGANPIVWTELARTTGGNPPSGAGFVGETGSGPDYQVEVRDAQVAPTAVPPRRFLRLRVSQP
ncbi:MAG: delta-60 repeat domain-containing protein [Verrucomicrobia bacterium]|nr:delta-60 repeat domain-containing protein [Verrucomicrobiota bacterium]